MYKIINVNHKHLFWSNTFGWTDRRTSDSFTKEEKKKLNLPIEGKWLEGGHK